MIILLILLFHRLGTGHSEKTTRELTSGNPVEMNADAVNWELRKHNGDVFIYQRWVEAESGRKARELYAEILSASSPEQLALVIREEKNGTEWLSMADEYRILEQPSDSVWFAYSKFNFTPALRFDLVTRNALKSNPSTGSVTIGINGKPDYLPEQSKFRRLSHFEGRWEFIPAGNHLTQIRYYMFSKTKPFLPRWITYPFVLNELENCMTTVRNIAEKP